MAALAVLFALGIYERVLFRGASPALLGVAALIGIAAILEELTYRCLLFRGERGWHYSYKRWYSPWRTWKTSNKAGSSMW